MERAEIFVKGDWMSTDAGMEGWNLKAVWPGAALPTMILNDWSVVPELSDVEATRYDFVVGGRYRTPGGFGLQLSYFLSKYDDDDPILEDETGSYQSIVALVGKSF